jgi:isopenicillin-N N-acyltransferase-like protein
MERKLSRRKFIGYGAYTSLGLLAGAAFPACREERSGPAPAGLKKAPVGLPQEKPAPKISGAPVKYVDGTERSFPYLEVSGSPKDVGLAIGRRFEKQIRLGFERRADWFKDLREFAMTGGRDAYNIFVAAAKKHTPRAFAEVEGWAEGSGVPFEDLMVLNLQAEFGELKKKQRADEKKQESRPGCSTIVVVAPDRILHLHNEDGSDAYADLMFMLKVRPNGGVPYLSLSYPGVLPGNAPAINENGLVQTTNFIASKEVRLGVGRYFLDRMILEAKGIDEALKWSTHPERAYAFHHVFSSVRERRAVAVEVTPSKSKVLPIDGLYIHTNHLVFDGMAEETQDEEYVSSSSLTRMRVLEAWKKDIRTPEKLTVQDLLKPLSSHEGKPYSPCRHPEGDVHGFTLGTAVFEIPPGSMRLYKNQPCTGRWTDYKI